MLTSFKTRGTFQVIHTGHATTFPQLYRSHVWLILVTDCTIDRTTSIFIYSPQEVSSVCLTKLCLCNLDCASCLHKTGRRFPQAPLLAPPGFLGLSSSHSTAVLSSLQHSCRKPHSPGLHTARPLYICT